MSVRTVLAGSVIVDVVMRVPQLPERGGDVIASSAEQVVGGGFNVLTAARRLGLPAVYGGGHGTGPFGELVRAALQTERIDLLLPTHAGRDTGYCVALVDSGGERTFVTAPGAEGALTSQDIERMAQQLRPGDLVQLSGYGLAYPESADELTGFVAGLPEDIVLCMDPGPLVADIAPERLERVLSRVDWLSCNRREARLMASVSEGARAAEVLARRLKPGAGALVRGDADGCWLASGRDSATAVRGRRVQLVDSNGAGDAHVGAFLAFLGHGAEPLEAARGANAAASVAVTRPGPATSPTAVELADLLGPEDPLASFLTG